MPPHIQTITDPNKAKALANQTRIQILQEIATTPQSLSQLARKLNITPVAVLYHIKKLKTAGFIRLANTKVVNNNLTEKFYEITTDAYLVTATASTQTPRGPVPPKNQEQLLIGITPQDIKKMFDLLDLTYPPQNKAQVEGTVINLLEQMVLKAREVHREILNQSGLKLSAVDRQKLEYITMATLPITIDQMLAQQETKEKMQTVIKLLQKRK
jgi:predicted transcriptional regulator